MKIKILTITIILTSLISWILWSYIFQTYFYTQNASLNTSIQNNTENILQNTYSLTDIQTEITDIVKNHSQSVVSIIIKKDLVIYKTDPWWFFRQAIWTVKEKVWWWTWFFVTKDGVIITNKHVISDKNAIYTVITNSQEEYDAKILAIDPTTDLAILKIESQKETIALEFINDEKEIRVGEFSIAIGNALWELNNSVSLWVISWKDRVIKDWNINLYWLLQTDAAINPWNSWWPLVNLDWKVMWINTAIINWSEWIWFSILLTEKKINYMLDSINKYGLIKKPFIWINYVLINEDIKTKYNLASDYWAYIIDDENSIVSWSNASKSWLEPWDIITKVDDQIVSSGSSLSDIISTKIPWEKVVLEVIKKSWETKNIELTLWEI